MNFHLQSAKLSGNPDESGWAQVHEFVPTESEKLKLRGHFFAVISTSQELSHGRELLARIHEEYFGNLEASAYEALKSSVENVHKEFSDQEDEVRIAAAAIISGFVYIAAVGTEAFMFRRGGLLQLLSSTQSPTSASGRPEDGDILLLSTRGLVEGFGRQLLQEGLQSEGLGIVEGLASKLRSKEGQGSSAMVAVRFSQVQEVVDEVPEVAEKREEVEAADASLVSPEPKKFSGRLFKRKIYVKNALDVVGESRRRKTAVTVGVLLLLLLGTSIIFGIRNRDLKAQTQIYEAKLSEANHNIEEARALFALNPQRARELFANSKGLVEELEKEFPGKDEVKKLKAQLDEGKETVLGEFDTVAEEFLDLTLIEGFEAGSMSADTDTVYVYDKNRKRIAEVVLDTKKTEVVVGPSNINSLKSFSAYSGRVFDLENDGIYEVRGDRRAEVVQHDVLDLAERVLGNVPQVGGIGQPAHGPLPLPGQWAVDQLEEAEQEERKRQQHGPEPFRGDARRDVSAQGIYQIDDPAVPLSSVHP